jgi:hypothetical protein
MTFLPLIIAWTSMPFEELNFAFMLFGGNTGVERAEVAALARRGAFLPRIEAVFA